MIETMEKRAIRRQQREVIEAIRKFEKRSKFITLLRHDSYWGLCTGQINISKREGKVINELIEYLNSLCGFVEKDANGFWFCTNNPYEINENKNDWDLEFEFSILFTK